MSRTIVIGCLLDRPCDVVHWQLAKAMLALTAEPIRQNADADCSYSDWQ